MVVYPSDIAAVNYVLDFWLSLATILGVSALMLLLLGGVTDYLRIKVGGWSMRYTVAGIILVWLTLAVIGYLFVIDLL